MGTRRISTRAAARLAVLTLLLTLAPSACTPEDTPGGMQGPSAGSRGTSPFTGVRGRNGPVLGVKIDNVRAARPHTGLDQADIVYVERVEWGLSRFLAVFSARLPDVIGPVRSAREADLELLRQFDEPALAFSGAQSKLLPVIDDAPLFPLPPGTAGDAYFRGRSRSAPHNLYVRGEQALRKAPDASAARDIGFRFGAAPRSGGKVTPEHTVRYPHARFGFTWSADRERWLVSLDGRAATVSGGKRLAAATVVVQYVEIRDSGYRDRSGGVSPYTETTGDGRALVLRDGRAFTAGWERPVDTDGTTFTDADGERLAFAPGPVWVVYAER